MASHFFIPIFTFYSPLNAFFYSNRIIYSSIVFRFLYEPSLTLLRLSSKTYAQERVLSYFVPVRYFFYSLVPFILFPFFVLSEGVLFTPTHVLSIYLPLHVSILCPLPATCTSLSLCILLQSVRDYLQNTLSPVPASTLRLLLTHS